MVPPPYGLMPPPEMADLQSIKRQSLTPNQTKQLRCLEELLLESLSDRNFNRAKQAIRQIINLLKPLGHHTKLLKYKNRYFEAVMEYGDLDKAIRAFTEIRQLAPKRTRVRLEATTLLAVAHLRAHNIEAAKPMIQEVFQSAGVIQSAARRSEFKSLAYDRFDEEIVLSSCKNIGRDYLYAERILEEAEVLSRKSDSEILYAIAQAAPGEAILALQKVSSFSLLQLPYQERKLLTNGRDVLDERDVGDTLFKAFRRVLYPSFCDPNNDFYKNFYDRPLKGVVASAVIAAGVSKYMQSSNITFYGLAVGICAMLIKLGVATFCERYKPKGLLVDFR
jgi:tetratricopeptide (TPR) repeat protein